MNLVDYNHVDALELGIAGKDAEHNARGSKHNAGVLPNPSLVPNVISHVATFVARYAARPTLLGHPLRYADGGDPAGLRHENVESAQVSVGGRLGEDAWYLRRLPAAGLTGDDGHGGLGIKQRVGNGTGHVVGGQLLTLVQHGLVGRR